MPVVHIVLLLSLLAASPHLLAQQTSPSKPLTAAEREELRRRAEALRERNAREREEIQKGFRSSSSPEPPASGASGVTPAQICRATIGAVMGRDPRIISVDREEGGITYVSYRRPDDGKLWSHKCKVEGNSVIWGMRDGRWRDHPLDGTVSYGLSGNVLIIRQRHSDGSSTQDSYPLAGL